MTIIIFQCKSPPGYPVGANFFHPMSKLGFELIKINIFVDLNSHCNFITLAYKTKSEVFGKQILQMKQEHCMYTKGKELD